MGGENVESPYMNNSQEFTEVIDVYTLKSRLDEQRDKILKADGNTAQFLQQQQSLLMDNAKRIKKNKTKALTTDKAKLKDFNKVIVYCPICQGGGGTHRMTPHPLETLLNNPEAYTKLVGGLAFADDTTYLHCSNCNLMLIPSVDDVEKLDARTEDEYEITSLADVKQKGKKPVIAGQSSRYNKGKAKKEEIYNRRKRLAQEQLSQDYEYKGLNHNNDRD